MSTKRTENGRIKEIWENGELKWTEDNTLRRPKITDKSKKSIANDLDSGNLESAINKLMEIVSGETKEEILGVDNS
mgnify:CR=1 FL=1